MQHTEMDSVEKEGKASLLSVRARNCYKIWEVSPCSSAQAGEPKVRAMITGDIASAKWSPDASYFALNSSTEGLVLCQLGDKSDGSEPYTKFRLDLPPHLRNLPPKQLKWMSFSPQGTYLLTYYHASGHGLVDLYGPNYLVWFVKRGESGGIESASVALAERYKNMMAPGPLQWRSDESVRVLTSGGRVSVLDGHDFGARPFVSFAYPGRFQVSIAPPREAGEIILSLFSPASENSKGPAELRFLFVDRRPTLSACMSRCEFVGVDGCEISWAPSVQRCLIMTSTLVDEAGENYGSVGDLWLCQFEATKAAAASFPLTITHNEIIDLKLSNYKSLPRLNAIKLNRRLTQDASWSPIRDEFIVIEGKSPSDVYAMDGVDGRVLHTFPKGYRNKVLWNSSGDMVAIGGFGNLAGDLSFYYRSKATEMILISEIREGCTVLCDWSPCGNYFFTASVRPRMNVDNQIKIWSRDGNKIYHIPFDELYDVAWRNDSYKLYPSLAPPQASVGLVAKSMYRPKSSSAAKDDQLELVDRFLKGELKECDLPEELRRSALITSRRNANTNRTQNYDKNRQEKKAADLAMDWRTSITEPPLLEPLPAQPEPLSARKQQPAPKLPARPLDNAAPARISPLETAAPARMSPLETAAPARISPVESAAPARTSPPVESPIPCGNPVGAKSRPEDATLMSLLQSILPSSAKVHLCDDGPPPAFPQARQQQQQTMSATAAEQEHFMQIMRQAGMLIAPPAKHPLPRPQMEQAPTLQQSAAAARAPLPQRLYFPPPLMSNNPAHDKSPPPPLHQTHQLPQQQQGRQNNLWQYVDPKGNKQGPFTRKQMRAWWEKGYFSGNLLVRSENSGPFRPLREVFPDASGVFFSDV